ncbi:MAG TPA: anaerobic ribonucleoside-triphosphate reductase [Spirochaetota bacterium]|nr:anaerobic ribonucleoside-triphosphate reductase [Spirochaetota bacterium]
MNIKSSNSNNSKVIPVEVYSRVVGYYRPVNQWNLGKQEEFKDRELYDINDQFYI